MKLSHAIAIGSAMRNEVHPVERRAREQHGTAFCNSDVS
jgi:hypothetical protein